MENNKNNEQNERCKRFYATQRSIFIKRVKYKYDFPPEDSKDIFQNTLMKFLKKTETNEAYKCLNDEEAGALLYKIFEELVIDAIRRKNKHSDYVKEASYTDSYCENNEAEDNFNSESLKIILKKLMECLPEKTKSVIEDKFFNNMSSREIGVKYDMEAGAVRVLVFASLKRMKENINKNGFIF